MRGYVMVKGMDMGMVRGLLGRMRGVRPRSRGELGGWVEAYLGLKVPGKRICEGHDSPLDYLAYSFLGEGAGEHRDCVVWANRGGGKTQLGAVATLLEGVFERGCQVRILGGSEEQSRLMYEYLRGMLGDGFGGYVDGRVTKEGCRFVGGGGVQVLAQSDRSVRGHHVQRLRCDEVELFDREVWEAAQYVTQSKGAMAGRLEVFSTMHRPWGLMHEIVGESAGNGMRLFRWCLWEVIERCEGRSCSSCILWEDCRGKAKEAEGYYAVEDAIAVKRRSGAASWQAEMLCERCSREDVVFGEFSVGRHVRELGYGSDLSLYRAIDFGFSNPLVCLFIQVDGDRVYVIDEHVKSQTTLAEHARLIKEQYPYEVEATYCDPAGRGRNEITGTNAMTELKALGMPCRARVSRVLEGIDLIRDYLAPAWGEPRLYVGRRCEHLIRALEGLHYKRLGNGALSEQPEKDGVHDHLVDALRYFFVNRFGRKYDVQEKKY